LDCPADPPRRVGRRRRPELREAQALEIVGVRIGVNTIISP
jgi:hypothetical protein